MTKITIALDTEDLAASRDSLMRAGEFFSDAGSTKWHGIADALRDASSEFGDLVNEAEGDDEGDDEGGDEDEGVAWQSVRHR